MNKSAQNGSTPFEGARLKLARVRVNKSESLGPSLRTVTGLVAEALAVERVSIWLFEPDRQAIRCFHLLHASNHEVLQGSVLRRKDFPQYFRMLESARVIPLDTERARQADEFREPYLIPLGISAMLDAPLYRAGEVMGVVCLEHMGGTRAWTHEEEAFAIVVAETISRLFEEAARLRAETSLAAYETQLMQLQRVEALGRLAAGVAHDFRNVLSIVIGNAELLAANDKLPDDAAQSARDILDAARRGSRISSELLAYGRETTYHPQVLDLSEAIAGMEGLLHHAIGTQVELEVDCRRGLRRIFADRSQVERVALNLTLNARDAMPKDGHAVIRVDEQRIVSPWQREDTYVVLSVSDTGVGMDEATKQHMCDPFFTTKGAAGTGLGMAIVNQVMNRSGGFIDVDSAPGRGTIIRCCFPPIAPARG